jgi:hypothetical protein
MAQIRHQLYVRIAAAGDHDFGTPAWARHRAATLRVLRYLSDRRASIRQMGIDIQVIKVRGCDLANRQVVQAMKSRNITLLPTLVTAAMPYSGPTAIIDLYEKNIAELAAMKRRGESEVEGYQEEDVLDAFYRENMTLKAAEDDMEESGIGQQKNMMDSYHDMLHRRETTSAASRPPQPGRAPAGGRAPAAAGHASAARAPAAPAPPARGDNVSEDDYDVMISRLAGDVGSVRDISQGETVVGECVDEDADGDAKDTAMERAFYANLRATDL